MLVLYLPLLAEPITCFSSLFPNLPLREPSFFSTLSTSPTLPILSSSPETIISFNELSNSPLISLSDSLQSSPTFELPEMPSPQYDSPPKTDLFDNRFDADTPSPPNTSSSSSSVSKSDSHPFPISPNEQLGRLKSPESTTLSHNFNPRSDLFEQNLPCFPPSPSHGLSSSKTADLSSALLRFS
ncbi:hypothetical protein Syun_008389 [Stephania yunnanensis]|uniref:Uncharacterized protein n=1 Tax=Stephania yunnanensis TaxID=152371 RepID=A0AAP0KDP1_9MAGN